VFPVRYELDSYRNLLRNSVFKGLNTNRRSGVRGPQSTMTNQQLRYFMVLLQIKMIAHTALKGAVLHTRDRAAVS
jgi:hypothetical protein